MSQPNDQHRSARLPIVADRQELANIIYACLYLLEHPEINVQTVALGTTTELAITCANQYEHHLETDPAKVECRKFIEYNRSVLRGAVLGRALADEMTRR